MLPLAVAGLFGLSIAGLVVSAVATSRTAEQWSLDFVHGIPAKFDAQALEIEGRALAELRGTRTFLLAPHAGFFYLASGLQNPSTSDYPARTTFGARGPRRVIDEVRSGAIDFICFVPEFADDDLAPDEIVDFVREEGRFVERVGPCDLYAFDVQRIDP